MCERLITFWEVSEVWKEKEEESRRSDFVVSWMTKEARFRSGQ